MIILSFLLLILDFISCQDYCDICENHIACNNSGTISEDCDYKAVMIDLVGTGLKDMFLHLHNINRNNIALGIISHFTPAARMPTMIWNNELAMLAELNVKTCKFECDECHNTMEFQDSGQSLGFWARYEMISPQVVVNKTVHKWFMQHKISSMHVIRSYHSHGIGGGHFEIMVNDKNTQLGCAILQQFDIPFKTYTIACNYATNNIDGHPIYKTGKTATECTTGPNVDYPGLCSISEIVNPNIYVVYN